MTRYPNSACEAHLNVITSEPVCFICMNNEIESLRRDAGRDVESLEQDNAALRRYAKQLEALIAWDSMKARYGISVARQNLGSRPTAKRPKAMDARRRRRVE